MLFVTNRAPKTTIRLQKKGKKYNFDLNNNAPSNGVFFCETGAGEDHHEIGSQEFLKRLRESDYKQVLLFVHGFNTLPEAVFDQAQELQKLADKAKKKEAIVVPLIWPCDNDFGVVKDYWDDQKSADASGHSFARVLEKFLAWRNSEENEPDVAPCLKRINILAHSMGNRVLRQTLVNWDRYDLADGVPMLFRNIFMVAADVVNETLHVGEHGELIAHAARNVVVYYASDDLALRASKAANLRNKVASRRLGHTGPYNMKLTPGNVYVADCDDINTRYDTPTGHNYFRSGKTPGQPGDVFSHIFECIASGRVRVDDKDGRSVTLG